MTPSNPGFDSDASRRQFLFHTGAIASVAGAVAGPEHHPPPNLRPSGLR